MDPISLAILAAIGLYVLAAPDQATASIRSGAASAIGSGARAAAQSIGADMRSAAANRSAAHKDRVDRWKAAADNSRSARLKLKLDRVFGRGGVVESAGRRIGAHGRAAVQAGRVGWQNGRGSGQKGLPDRLRRRLEPVAASARSAARTARGKPVAPKSPDDKTPDAPTGSPATQEPAPKSAEGNTPVAMSSTAQPITTEAGLLPAAEQIASATGELGPLIEAAQAASAMLESLRFDPGEEVKAAIGVLAESAPSADTLRAFAEAAIGLETAVREHLVAVQGA